MRIGIDISQIVYGTGVSVYTRELVRNLLEVDKKNEYVLFGGSIRQKSNLRGFTLSLRGNFETKILSVSPTIADFIWNKIHRLKVEKLIGQVDVFHSSDWTQPPSRAFKVTTVHDLAPLKFPKLTLRKIVDAHKRRIYWVLKECDRIIVPSNATKDDLIAFGGRQEIIRVIPEAAEEIFKPQSENLIKAVKKKYQINGKYILSIGIGERKNTAELINAYSKIKSKGLKLVLVGLPSFKYKEARGVIFTGFVPQIDLPVLYSGAEALAYPSLYEGFGLPVVQAFACHTPVVISDTPALTEVGGDAVIKVDPMDSNSISAGILKAIARKVSLVRAGEKRLKDFSWGKTARQTLEVYSEASSKV